MIKIGNNRQKLVLNRPSKPSTQPSQQRPQLQIINFVKLSALQLGLECKDQNIMKLQNSSILQKNNHDKKQIQPFSLKKQKKQGQSIKRKSFSLTEEFIKQKNTNLRNIQRRSSKTLGKISFKKSSYESIIHTVSKDMLGRAKQKGTFTSKNNFYSIRCDNLYETISEIVKQVIEQTNKMNAKVEQRNPLIIRQLQLKSRQDFKIQTQFSFHQIVNKARILSHSSFIINFHETYIQKTNQKEMFWKMVQKLQIQKPTQQNFSFLINRYKYLKQEIRNKQVFLYQLNQNIEQQNQKISNQKKTIQLLQQKANQHQAYLSSIQQKITDINQFVNNQPNKILRSQAQGYKQREQQLFDQAFLLQQSTPLYLNSYIGDIILVPNQSFKLTLKSFPHQKADQHNLYRVTQKDINAFKSSLTKAYQSIIEKLSSIIQKKFDKIKKFVGIMRRLASYTIGKREYLTEINKKMAVVSTNTDKHIKKLQEFFINLQQNNSQSMKIVSETKSLFNVLRSLYCEAQVFY